MFTTLRTKGLFLAAALSLLALPALARTLVEPPFFADKVAKNELPPLAERLPQNPIVVNPPGGDYGGDVVTLVPRARDIRYISTYAYTRLVGYDRQLDLQPDLLERLENEDDRVFTFTLRAGHRWSDGSPFTAEDFRYYWEDVAQNRELSPAGPPEFMMVDGKLPRFEVLDERTVRYTWDKPNPRFLPQLAGPLDPGIYRASAYLKRFHAKYADQAALDEEARKQKLKSWAALHNRLDDMKEQTNPDLPTLQPWRITNTAPASRFVFERNPYYHRIDDEGRQLPYLDRIIMDVSAPGLFAAKANAGEVDLLFRGLSMTDVPILKEGEKAKGYKTLLWPYARGTELALYPNLNTTDPVWRKLNRDVRYRRALSLGIDRRTLNNALLFGLGVEGNNTVVAESPLFSPELRTLNATYDPTEASRLLDEIGLTERNGAGIRLLPDGRELEIIVETDGESSLVVDGLTLIAEFWREIGVKLFIKPQDRTVLRNRSYAGLTVMVASAGFDNAIPTAIMPPTEYAPMRQDNYAWPKWGQYVETKGKNGDPVDIPEAERLLQLYETWMNTGNRTVQREVWTEMLRNHAENQWVIGTVAGALQPIVLRNGLHGLPDKALYSWEPTAMIGIYRPDELYWNKAAGKEARR
ncbi:ABC transporter substrate-binding protein [Microvirga lenta]|uniref:ABC transporter substrate-binding protein n=1 Tax=Microvirga lenta TaxID=2881337 RepID=UPI001CFF892A|nr:ABC transporter substrate-binding protein [Microvirga lenta]MCB5176379.1 ABC transporter substrate-binding protein [Microvirga lenta]